MISQHFNKNNPHHAYLLEGEREEILPEIFSFVESIGVKTLGNPDFYNIALDSFKIEDARNLKSYAEEKSFSPDKNAKKIFIISANNFLIEAQNTLLKMFEEPIADTHFFVVVPDSDIFVKTLASRFYLIRAKNDGGELEEAQKFIRSSKRERLDFLKELLVEEEDEEIPSQDGARSRALKFLNAVEVTLHKNLKTLPISCFEQIFKVREFLRQPGSSAKNLMESLALSIPVL